ncbi:MAG: YihY/virulence factor BrkB family protein [Polyangiales bacterium]
MSRVSLTPKRPPPSSVVDPSKSAVPRWRHSVRGGLRLLRETVERYSRNGGSMLGGALAFYSALSAAPLLVIAVALAQQLVGLKAASGVLFEELRVPLGDDGAALVSRLMQQSEQTQGGALATLLGVLFLLYGASRLFMQVQRALNLIWGVRVRPHDAWTGWARGLVFKRLLSFAMVLLSGLLLALQLTSKTALTALGIWLAAPPFVPLLQLLEFLVSTAMLALLLATMYRVLPDVKIAWRDVWIGALCTAVLYTGSTFGLGLYLNYVGAVSAYGAAGAVVLLLLWFHYTAQVFFLGAEFTGVWARHHGHGIEPEDHAVRVVVDPRFSQP